MMSDLDELMSRDPCELSAQDIDAIIDYHRKQRARRAAGEKPIKPKSQGIDISSVVSKVIKQATPPVDFKRRKL